jgi:hypothetical protein
LQETAVKLRTAVFAVWPNLGDIAESHPQIWTEKVASPNVILVLENDRERTKKLIEPNQALTLHIVKNRGGETGKLAFDFFPAFSKLAEAMS